MHIAPIVWHAHRECCVPAGCYCFNCPAHTRQNKSQPTIPRTHISAKFGAKNLLRLNALNSRDALSIQRATLLAMNEKVNEYISLCLATLLNILQFCYTKQSNLCRCAI
jgi:hypothetical protein